MNHPVPAVLGAVLGLAAAAVLFAQTPSSPRDAAGHPDLNGTWDNGSGIDFIQPQHLAGGSVCVSGCDPPPAVAKSGASAAARPPRNFPKYRPEYLAKVAELEKNQ